MNDIDAQLMRQSPKPKRQLKANFTESVLMGIKAPPKPRHCVWIIKLRQLHARFNRLPQLAAVAIIIGGTGTIGGAAYAAYQWIAPKISVTQITPANDEGRREFSITSQCGDFMNGTARYEVAPGSRLTDEDAKKVFENTCAYTALQAFINHTWVGDNDASSFATKKVDNITTSYEDNNSFAGASKHNPIFGLTLGTITALDSNNITIATTMYTIDQSLSRNGTNGSPYGYYPEGKTIARTLPLLGGYQVWQDGKQIDRNSLHVGDTVQLVNRVQNKVQYYKDIHQNSLGAQTSFGTIAAIKTSINPKYVSDFAGGTGDPNITHALASLLPCHNNADYTCVFMQNGGGGAIYAVPDAGGTAEPFMPNNGHYLRTDHASKKVQSYQLEGRITAIDGKRITIRTRGKQATATISLPYDAISEYNKPKKATTDAEKATILPVGVGDLIDVLYIQLPKENHLAIKPGDIERLVVVQYADAHNTWHKY